MKLLHCCLPPLFFLCMTGAAAVEPQISAGRYQNMAIDSSGAVYLWRETKAPPHYPLASSLWHPSDMPTKVEGLPPAIGIAAGASEFVEVLTEDGSIYEWGYGSIQNEKAKAGHLFWGVCELLNIGSPGSGPCGMNAADFDAEFFTEKPKRVKDIPPATAIVASNLAVLALARNGDVYCWSIDAPAQRVPGLSDIVSFSLGQDHAIALRKDGAVVTWGRRALGLPFSPPQIDQHSLCDEPTSQVVMQDAIGVYATDYASYAWRKDGSLWGWGSIRAQAMFKRSMQVWQPEQIATVPGLKNVVAGPTGVVARNADNKVYQWVDHSNDRKVKDVIAQSSVTLSELNLPDTMAISTYNQSLALTKDGHVCVWNSGVDSRPHPVMLADENTPLNLYAKKAGLKEEPASLCNAGN